MKSFFGTDRLKRSRILKAILFIIIMISAVSSMSLLYKSVYAQEENQHKYAAKKRVLFISSYSYAWETVPEQIAGIKEVLNEDVVIDYKFMDSKNLTSSESVDDFYRHMVYYLGEVEPYDAIIVGDDAAFNFAVDNKDTLFKDIPIFFEGVNNGDKAVEVSASSQITGVVESLSYKNTIKAASKIIPDAKKIVAILDDTVTGMGERIQYYKYKNIFSEYANRIEALRKDLKRLKYLKIIQTDNTDRYDRSKFVISVKHVPMSSHELYEILLHRYHLQMEMLAGTYVLAMTTVGDTQEGLDRLRDALLEIDKEIDTRQGRPAAIETDLPLSGRQPALEKVWTIAEAVNRRDKIQKRSFEDSIGCISVEYAYLYPPGSPLIVPGERITKEAVEILHWYQEHDFSIEGLQSEDGIEVWIDG